MLSRLDFSPITAGPQARVDVPLFGGAMPGSPCSWFPPCHVRVLRYFCGKWLWVTGRAWNSTAWNSPSSHRAALRPAGQRGGAEGPRPAGLALRGRYLHRPGLLFMSSIALNPHLQWGHHVAVASSSPTILKRETKILGGEVYWNFHSMPK